MALRIALVVSGVLIKSIAAEDMRPLNVLMIAVDGRAPTDQILQCSLPLRKIVHVQIYARPERRLPTKRSWYPTLISWQPGEPRLPRSLLPIVLVRVSNREPL